MTALVPALAGALVVAGLLGTWLGVRPVPQRPPAPGPRRIPVVARLGRTSARTRLLLLAGTGAGLVVAIVTGWVIAILAVPAVIVGLPVLLSAPQAASTIDRLEAMQEWTRSLSGVLTVGVGLEQALIATLRSTPDAIRPEVTRLVARLGARWGTEDALRAFAADLDDATGDLVAANLILGARRRGRGLASVLESLAESVAADVRARQQIEADRAKPRATARWVTLITVGVLVFLTLTGRYVAPYGSPIGQVILTVLLGAYVATLAWMRQMTKGYADAQDYWVTGTESGVITGLRLALLGGGLVGLGVALLIWRLVPAQPDLGDALDRLSPEHIRRSRTAPAAAPTDSRERLGRWAMTTLPVGAWAKVPRTELALLRVPVSRFYGEKVLFAIVGLLTPPLMTLFFAVLGLRLPFVIPVVATVGFAGLMFFLPDYNARDEAKKARLEFTRALGAYIDLVALERNSASGPRQAMEVAADVGDSWVFRRLSEELTRSRWSGQAPWEAIRALGAELGVTELEDLADIMRLAGQETTAVYGQLRAKSAAMRAAMLNAELAKANEIGERMSIPMSLLGVIFMAILIAPALLRVIGGS